MHKLMIHIISKDVIDAVLIEEFIRDNFEILTIDYLQASSNPDRVAYTDEIDEQ